MNAHSSPALPGSVVSLHLHPSEPGERLQDTESVDLLPGKGIVGEPRYFGRISRDTGQPTRRQVSLIEREQITEHATALGFQGLAPGVVRSNIETQGINLVALVGQQIQVGSAVLFLYEPRRPCAKMDAICQGLRELMMNDRQGVMAEVVRSGTIRRGDPITVLAKSPESRVSRLESKP
jgi:MOSC domain-containing protein YiiM